MVDTIQKSAKTLTKRIVMTGGGSGGHIAPAQSLLDVLKLQYENAIDQILYIGGNLPMEGEKDGESLEQKVFKDTNMNFVAIRSGKLQRYFRISTITSLFKVIGGVFDAYKELKKFKPDLIFSTGGYVTVPVCFVGWLMRIPIYIHEQTAAVGLTNKITSLFAKRVFISFSASFKHFPRRKTLLTGLPISKAFFENKADDEWNSIITAMRQRMADESKPIITIVGGGQGSHIFNQVVANSLNALLKRYQIIISTGSNEVYKDYEMLVRKKEALPEDLQPCFLPQKYISKRNFGEVLKNSTVVVSRAGANSVYELGILKKRSIFIPIPWVTHNEQEKNARTLERQGFASIILEKDFNSETLLSEIENMVSMVLPKDFDESLFPTNAAEKIIEELEL
jgi:UDP-N-acetylglucosamine--N-acetylmuramyl-(pentapeptide) pyrophosphoryl-undecaprenol N-acetylglucosamine transferase